MLTYCYRQPNIRSSLNEVAYGTPNLHLHALRDRLDPAHSRPKEVYGLQ